MLLFYGMGAVGPSAAQKLDFDLSRARWSSAAQPAKEPL
jgi:hypothetical protein